MMSDPQPSPVPPPPPPFPSEAAKAAAIATDAARSFFKANMATGITVLVAAGLALVAGILGTSSAPRKTITLFDQSAQIAIVVAVGIFFFKRLMPSLKSWAIGVTNEAFGGVLALILNVLFLSVLANAFLGSVRSLAGGIPDVVGKLIETLLQRPAEIFTAFLRGLSLEAVAVVSLCSFVVAVIVRSMFFGGRKGA